MRKYVLHWNGCGNLWNLLLQKKNDEKRWRRLEKLRWTFLALCMSISTQSVLFGLSQDCVYYLSFVDKFIRGNKDHRIEIAIW